MRYKCSVSESSNNATCTYSWADYSCLTSDFKTSFENVLWFTQSQEVLLHTQRYVCFCMFLFSPACNSSPLPCTPPPCKGVCVPRPQCFVFRLQKATLCPVCLFVHMEQLIFHWIDFNEIWYLSIRKAVENIRFIKMCQE